MVLSGTLSRTRFMLDSFLALGHSRRKFLAPWRDVVDYGAKADNKGYIPEVGFGWFCMEWLRHWITYRHFDCRRSRKTA